MSPYSIAAMCCGLLFAVYNTNQKMWRDTSGLAASLRTRVVVPSVPFRSPQLHDS